MVSTFYLIKDVDFNRDYLGVVDFDDESLQRLYFQRKRVLGYNTSFNYIRGELQSLRVEIPQIVVNNYSYISFTNTGPDNIEKTYYAFIDEVRYIDPTTSQILFTIDVWQTYLFDYEIKDSFIDREHQNRFTSDLKPLFNTIPENVEVGTEYKVSTKALKNDNAIQKGELYTTILWLEVVSTEKLYDVGVPLKIEPYQLETPLYVYYLPFVAEEAILVYDFVDKENLKLWQLPGYLYKYCVDNPNVVSIRIEKYPPFKFDYTYNTGTGNLTYINIEINENSTNLVHTYSENNNGTITRLFVNLKKYNREDVQEIHKFKVEYDFNGIKSNNLFDINLIKNKNPTVIVENNSIKINKLYFNRMTNIGINLNLKPNKTYTTSRTIDYYNGRVTGRIVLLHKNGYSAGIIIISNEGLGTKTTTFTTPSNIEDYTGVYIYGDDDHIVTFSNISINEGTTVLPYQPYFVNDHTINRRIENETKLYQYPYNFMQLTNYRGEYVNLKPEYLSDDEWIIKYVKSISFDYKTKAYVDGYLGQRLGLESNVIDNTNSELPLTTDAYKQYMATSKATATTGLAINAGLGVAGTVAGGLMLGAGGPVGALAFLALGLAVSGFTSVKSELLQQRNLKETPDSLRQSGNNLMFDLIDNNISHYLTKKQILDEYRDLLYDYFYRYGYKANRFDVPDLRSRYYFNYIKTVSINIVGNINNNVKEALKQIFNNGTTIWHARVDNNNPELFSYVKENIEVEL